MAGLATSREITDEAWDRQEHDWTNKSFYYANVTFLLGSALGLDNKLEELNREIRSNNYKIKNPMVLIQSGKFKGRIMIEIEKKDQYDAQVVTYDTPTNCDTIIAYGGKAGIGKGVEKLKERVAARRGMDAREVYYLFQPDPNAQKTIIFALT